MVTDSAAPVSTAPGAGAGVPEKPTLDGLERKWAAHWAEADTYAFDRAAALAAPRERTYSIDTPPPTASGSLHAGHGFSYTHPDLVAPYPRTRGPRARRPPGRAHSLHRPPAARGQRVPARGARVQLHPPRLRRPLPADARPARLLPDGLGRPRGGHPAAGARM